MADLFPGFRRERIRANGIEVNAVVGPKRDGPALLLLHGYPQTLAIWHKVAPRLAERFNVVATDLRGYGDSGKPDGGPKHEAYSKREMARDQVEAMRALGHERFFLCGHDRGARVAHRLCVDHPGRVERVAMLDIAPTLAMYESTTEAFRERYLKIVGETARPHLWPVQRDRVRILPSTLGELSQAIGAALVALYSARS